MNVILIRSNPVNPDPRVEKMAKCLMNYGYGVTILAWDRDLDYAPREEQIELEGIKIPIVRIGIKGQFGGGLVKNLAGMLKFQRFIYKWLKSNKKNYDIIHAYDLDTGFVAQKTSKLLGKVFIYDIADYYSNGHDYSGKIGTIVNAIENTVINKAFATIICTEEREKEIEGSKPQRLFVIHNTPDIRIYDTYHKEINKRTSIVYIGIFSPNRFLIELAEYIASRTDCELHIGGFGGKNMVEYFEKMDRSYQNIFYYGKVPYTKTIEIEKKGDILAIIYDPSFLNHVYAAPNKFYEALALGKPMIMAKGTGMSSVLEKYDLGETMEYNKEGLEKAINNLINRKEEWPLMGERGRKLYDNNYSWKEMEKRIYKLYNEASCSIGRDDRQKE